VARAAAVDPNGDIADRTKTWLCCVIANNPSYWDPDIPEECLGYGGSPGLGEMPLGNGGLGWAWDVL
jgi:hypothetical protein